MGAVPFKRVYSHFRPILAGKFKTLPLYLLSAGDVAGAAE
jgi:hypothetical protein